MIRKKVTLSNSIFLQLLLAFVLAVLVPTLIISVTSVWASYQIGQQRTLDQLNSIATLKSAEIDMWTNELDIGLDTLLREQDMTESVLPLLQGSLSPADARQAHDRILRNLNQMTAQTRVFNQVCLMDANGRVIASTNPAQEGMDLSNTDYYQQGLQKNFITPPFHASPQDQHLIIVKSHPIILPGKGAIGVLAGTSDISVLNRIMESPTGLGQTGESYLVGPDYAPLTLLRFQAEPSISQVKSDGIRSALETRVHGYGLYHNYRDTPVVGWYTWLPTLQVALVVEQAQAEAFNSAFTMLAINLGVAFTAVLLTVLAAFIVTRRIATPLTTLSETATRIAAGDLNHLVEVNRQDEIGKLAQAFNHMTGQLRNLIEQLQAELAERRKAEEALRVSEDKFKYVFEYSIAGKSITLPSGEMQANKAFADFLGYTQVELQHLKWQEITHPDEIETTQRALNIILSGEKDSMRWEKRYIHKNGSIVWADISTSLRRDATGKPLYYMSNIIDISERVRAEEEIRKLNAELEQRVQQRTADLQVVNKELEAFSYSISHDLRTPLRSINGFAHILLDDYADKLDTAGKQHLQRVRTASQRMGELIEDLLSLSRLSRSELQHQATDLSALAQRVAEALQQEEPGRQVEITIAPGMQAYGDERMLHIVLENLMGNAWKFTSRHPSARIEVGVTPCNGETAYFVRDDGAGFDMKYAGKLFGAFQRLHSAAEFDGLGIGLATVQRIIHRHGGRVWAESAVEQGATFYFTLPLKDGMLG